MTEVKWAHGKGRTELGERIGRESVEGGSKGNGANVSASCMVHQCFTFSQLHTHIKVIHNPLRLLSVAKDAKF